MKKISTVLFLLLFSSSLIFGQSRGLRLIEKDKFSTVERRLDKDISKQPNDVGLNYEMAVLLTQKGYDKYSPESAYMFLMKTMSLYENTTDPKVLKSLDKIPINKTLFQNYNDTICRHALEDAIATNSVEAYERFLTYFKTSPVIYLSRAVSNRDIVAFLLACEKHTVDAYQSFITKYPDAVQKGEAIKKRDQLAFGIVKGIDKIESYKEFINKYPEAPEVNEAWERVYELAFAVAEQENTLQAYKKFVDEYPKSSQYAVALSRVNEMNYALAEKENTSAAYKKFLDENPGSKQYEKAFKLFEEKQYLEIKRDGDWMSLKTFIDKCPNNSWKSVALDSICAIGLRTEDLGALKYTTDSLKGSKRNDALLLYHDVFTNDGEKSTLDLFYKAYPDTIFNAIKTKDYALAELGNNLALELPYKPADFQKYDEYIRKAAPNEKAFVALQRIISSDINVKDWKFALNKLNTYVSCFKTKNRKVKDLIALLESATDNTIQITSVGPGINTVEGDEYQPVITADDKSLYFCGRGRKDNVSSEDIFVSNKVNEVWSDAKIVSDLSPAGSNNVQFSITTDGTRMILFRSGKLYYSDKTAGGWGDAIPFPDIINSGKWQSDAMISADGKVLLFASVREGGYNLETPNMIYHGDSQYPVDIYVSLLNEKNEWGKPINLGKVINTPYCDRMPCLAPDMKTLYFSSDGHGGLGGLDVFKTTRLSDTCWARWSEPINLGKEINTEGSDRNYKISDDGTRAYFSKKITSQDKEDIYSINLPKSLRPEAVTTITGKLIDKGNHPVVSEIRWEDLETGKEMGRAKSDPVDGSFFINLPLGKNYGYYVNKEGYFPYSNNIDLRNNNYKPVKVDATINMVTYQQMVEDGTVVILNNLFFNPSESVILTASIPELKRIAAIIKTNNLKVTLAGHTDNVGDDKQLQSLSEQMADAVKTFFVKEGCFSDKITFEGFGKTRPIAPNETEAGRAKNKRVELEFIK
jgi:outer membrane protein OmpA-like peptidoglycan-associated protein